MKKYIIIIMFILDYLSNDFFFKNSQGLNILCLLCLYIIIIIFTLKKLVRIIFSTKKNYNKHKQYFVY